jgi:anti-sigma factor RsiW
MDPELTPREVEDLLAAYALDAVDDDERDAVEHYLADHPDAAAEVQAFRHAAAMLAYTGGPVPEGVWDALAPSLEARRAREQRAEGVVPLMSRRAQPEPMPGSPPRRGTHRVRWLAAAAVAAVLAVGATVGIVVAQSGGGGSSGRQTLAEAARAARDKPGARQVTLTDPAGRPLAEAVLLRDGTGYLTSNLPALGAGRTYQLWALADPKPVSLGVMGRDPHVVGFKVKGPASALAVTNEVAGGVMQPTSEPAATGKIPSV